MAFEIERKFLVLSREYGTLATPEIFIQGYISIQEDKIVRVRIAGDKAFVTFKSKISNTRRNEYEYEIPLDDAKSMLETMCLPNKIEKLRYKIMHDGNLWEVDEFKGANAGLIIAEIELTSEEQHFSKPSWVGEEVTDDMRYLNAHLALKPYSQWF
jgi:adenylate cyclase